MGTRQTPANQTPEEIAKVLVRMDPALEPHAASLASLFLAVPIPLASCAHALVTALVRLTKSVPWLGVEIQEMWANGGWLFEIDGALRKVSKSQGWHWSTLGDGHLKGGVFNQYPVYSALLDDRAFVPAGLEQMRAALLLCRLRWEASHDERFSILQDLAAAIRAARDGKSAPLSNCFGSFHRAPTPGALAKQSEVLAHCGHETLARIWPNYVVPVLNGEGRTRRKSATPDPPPPIEPVQELPVRALKPKVAEGHTTRKSQPARRESIPTRGYIHALNTERQVPGEPVIEVVTPSFVMEIPPVIGGVESGRRVLYRAQQAIWSGNPHLLANHPAVAPSSLLKVVCRATVEEMEAGGSGLPVGLRRGLAGLALMGATGKTIGNLSDLAWLSAGQRLPIGKRWGLDLEASTMVERPLELDGAFFPDDDQSKALEMVDSVFTLPLPKKLSACLKRAWEDRVLGSHHVESQWEAEIREACGYLELRLGFPVRYGEIRRAFSCQSMDRCNDSARVSQICGDTLGQSAAPNYYYAPRKAALIDAYATTVGDLFADLTGEVQSAAASGRIGARSLATESHVAELAGCLGRASHAGVPDPVDLAGIIKIHQGVQDQLLAMLLGVCGHRPTGALFRLSLGDLDWGQGLALFSDKQIDIAHYPRLASLPPIVQEQVKAYLEHLSALAHFAISEGPLRERINATLAGDEPLFFVISPAGEVEDLTLADWAQSLPPVWRALPLNWGRCHLRTRAVELGADPVSVSIQLGHLEAAGYPFSEGSPTEPLEWACAIQPMLERLARKSGWKVRRGFRQADSSSPAVPLFPLRTWSKDIQTWETRQKDAHRKVMAHAKAQLRENKEKGLQAALQIVAKNYPDVAAAWSDPSAPAPSGWGDSPEKWVATLQVQIEQQTGENLVQQIAAANGLSTLVAQMNKRYGTRVPLPPRKRLLHRPRDNPFFPGMLQACRQVDHLRSCVIAKKLDKQNGHLKSRDHAFARVALILVLFGGFERFEDVVRVLEGRASAKRSKIVADLLLLPRQGIAGQVLAVRWLAALAVAAIAKRFPTGAVPDEQRLGCLAAGFLPPDACPNPARLFEYLCETVGVANRLEMSPAARLGAQKVGGCQTADALEQVALLDGDPVGTIVHSLDEGPDLIDPRQTLEVAEKVSGRTIRRQYLALLSLLPDGRKDTELPKTGMKVPATRAASNETRSLLVLELQAWLADPTIHPNVRLLAYWAAKMFAEGTAKTDAPAVSTVHTYVSRIGGGLAAEDSRPLSELDDGELESLYTEIIEAKSPHNRSNTAREILTFHRAVAPVFGLDEIDESVVRIYLGNSPELADAHLILPQEREAAMQEALHQAVDHRLGKQSERLGTRRVARQAAALLALLSYTGARSGEPLGCQVRDLQIGVAGRIVRFASNGNRRLKTRRSRRYVEVTGIPANGAKFLQSWVEAERARHARRFRKRAYLFSKMDSTGDMTGKPDVRMEAASVLGAITGRRKERLHRLRHLRGFEGIASVVVNGEDWESLKALWSTDAVFPSKVVVTPRDLHEQTVCLGHIEPATTLRSYFHMPWLLRSRADGRLRRWMTRQAAAFALGVTVAAIDRISQRSKSTSDRDAWLNHCIAPREAALAPRVVDEDSTVVDSGYSMLGVMDVAQLCGLVTRTGSLEKTSLVAGATADDISLLNALTQEFEAKAGGALWRRPGAQPTGVNVRLLRELRSLEGLTKMWEWLDKDPNSAQSRKVIAISRTCFSYMRPSDGHEVVLPLTEIPRMQELLVLVGIPSNLIEVVPGTERGQVNVRVTRPGVHKSPRYAGRAIKRALGIVYLAMRHREITT